MNRFTMLLLFFVSFGFYSAFGQSSCSCSAYDCSVSQSCPSGYVASCSCTASGCRGGCLKANAELIEFEISGQRLVNTLMGSDEKEISQEFSRSIGRQVVFTKAPEVQVLAVDMPSFKSYWEVVEFLAAKGKITINGLPFEIWKGKRDTLLTGGAV